MAGLVADSFRVEGWPTNPRIEAVWTNPDQAVIDLLVHANTTGLSVELESWGWLRVLDVRIERGDNVVLIVKGIRG